MRPFWKAFLIVAIPIVLLSLISTSGNVNDSSIATAWFVAGVLFFIGLIGMIFLYATGRSGAGSGALAALGVGALALALTCFSNLNEVSF